MNRHTLLLPLALAVVVAPVACKERPAPPSTTSVEVAPATPAVAFDPILLAPFQPLPKVAESSANPVTDEKAALGRLLYFDARLSKNHDVSCESCHHLAQYGVDGEVTSSGHKRQRGSRNAPTVYNAAIHFRQFWDGRASTVEEQAKGPILNPVEMAMPNEERVVRTLRSMPGYVDAFRKAFPGDPDPVTFDNTAKAIAAFERRLLVRSRWDECLEGRTEALDGAELAGLRRFVEVGCPTCHYGPGVGGTMYQKLGLAVPWRDTRDPGRYAVTKDEADRMTFKVPSLRNVDKTGPYFHDGSVASLDEAVRLMARHQLGKELGDGDVRAIVTFLGALTGPLPAELAKPPSLPPSTATTPKPDPS